MFNDKFDYYVSTTKQLVLRIHLNNYSDIRLHQFKRIAETKYTHSSLYRNMHLSKYYKRNKFYYIINKIKNRSRFKMIFLPKIVWFWIQANR